VSDFAHPYARAFVECAPANYDFGAFLAAGETLSAAIHANPQLHAFLQSPAVPKEAKSKAVAQLAAKAGLDTFASRFLQVLLKNHRLLEAGHVFRAIRDAHDAAEGVVRAQITVATPIGEPERKMIEDALVARTGKRVRLQVDLNAAILAGFVARIGSRVFDGSADAAIRKFGTDIRQRTGA
jgi:F-type H+-transporting ATPase subunit delta